MWSGLSIAMPAPSTVDAPIGDWRGVHGLRVLFKRIDAILLMCLRDRPSVMS